MTPSLARSSLATSRTTAITSANRSSIAASRAATLQSGFSNGVFVNTHNHAFVHDNVFVVSHGHYHYHDYHHHHGCYPYFTFGFSIGFGYGYGYGYYPYYGYYGYPYYSYYPYYPYYGYYAGYPAPVYYYPPPPYYDRYYSDRNYVTHDAPAGGASPASAPPAAEAVSPPAGGAQQQDEDITPIPPEEMRDRASADPVPSVKMEIAERTALNGLAEFRSGSYSEAADTLFNAVQADPASPTLKVYLAEALYAMGEYKFAAEYLRLALDARPELIQKSFPLGRLYAPSQQGEQDLAEHYEQLAAWTALRPYDTDALVVLGFVQLQSGRLAEAGTTAIALRNGSTSQSDRAMAERLFAESEVRSGARPEASPPLSPEPSDDDDRLARTLVSSLES